MSIAVTENQLRYFLVDGVNIEDKFFNWKKKFFIGGFKKRAKNFVTAGMVIPFEDKDYDGKPVEIWVADQSKDDEIALWPVSLFFSCYHLKNPKQQMPKIRKEMWSAINNVVPESVESIAVARAIPQFETQRNVRPIIESRKAIKRTLSLFDKVMNIYESTSKKIHPIIIALILYQRAVEEDDHLISFLDLVMALESLFSDGQGEITYKFALRTSNFVESKTAERHDLFEKLKEAYRYRSKLVHGDDLSLNRFGEYNNQKYFMLKIVQKTLLKYIPMALSGKSKKQIYGEIDDYSLRVKKKL